MNSGRKSVESGNRLVVQVVASRGTKDSWQQEDRMKKETKGGHDDDGRIESWFKQEKNRPAERSALHDGEIVGSE